jgi:hypothetical protein
MCIDSGLTSVYGTYPWHLCFPKARAKIHFLYAPGVAIARLPTWPNISHPVILYLLLQKLPTSSNVSPSALHQNEAAMGALNPDCGVGCECDVNFPPTLVTPINNLYLHYLAGLSVSISAKGYAYVSSSTSSTQPLSTLTSASAKSSSVETKVLQLGGILCGDVVVSGTIIGRVFRCWVVAAVLA